MAQVTARKRGKTWEYGFEGPKIGGKRNRFTKGGFRTKGDALEAGTKALAEYNQSGMHFEPSKISVSDYLDYWLEEHIKKNMDYNTYLDYESKVRIHIKPNLGQYRLCALRPDAIQKWINSVKQKGYAKNMVSNILSCLSGALNYAVQPCQYIETNPCFCVKIPRIQENKIKKEHTDYICGKEDFSKIIDRFGPDSNFYIPLMIGYHLGTRIGETYGIDLLKDVDFEKGELKIQQQVQKEGKNWYYRSPKYDSYRTLKLGGIISDILKKEMIERKKNILKYGEYFVKTYVMPNNSIVQYPASISVPYREIMPVSAKENGALLTPHSFHYCARVIHYELGIPLFHSHALRHTHGTILAENGVNPKTVMERLGHKNIQTTLQTYIFNTDKMQQDAVDIFESAIS